MEKPAISTLVPDLAAAYTRLTHDFARIGRTPDGQPCFPDDDEVVRALLRTAASRCGAAVGTAVKREKRRLLLLGLASAKSEGYDITPAVAQGTAHRLLNRGLDPKPLARMFATPGRTAANKSKVCAEDLAALELELDHRLGPLLREIDERKQRARKEWAGSPERAKVLDDWRKQRRSRKQPEYKAT